ncbi:hypothetical protein ACWDO0_27970 [Nocardia rhamnosiphila]
MTSSPTRGLTLSVYRSAEFDTDFTRGGITGRHNRVTLIGFLDTTDPELCGSVVSVADWRPHIVHADAPPVIAIIRRSGLAGDGARIAHLQPVELSAEGRVSQPPGAAMYGGNLAGTDDSRFGEVLSALLGYPAPKVVGVHDRYER